MSTSMTLGELRTAARQRADMVNSQFVTDSEFNSYLNQSYFELYDLLVQKYGNDYYVAPPLLIPTDGSSMFYPLPDGTNYSAAPAFYKILGLDLQLSPGSPPSYVTVKPFAFIDRNRYAVPNFQSFYGITNLRYRIKGNQLWLTPIPAGNQVLQLWYVPTLTTLGLDSDQCQGVSGWTEYIIIDAAIKAMQKEESDVSVLMSQKQAMILRIEAAAENRDAGSPSAVTDARWSDGSMPTGNGSGFGGSW